MAKSKFENQLVIKAHSLIMQGLTAKETRQRLSLSPYQWQILTNQKLYTSLILGAASFNNHFDSPAQKLKKIEQELFRLIEVFHKEKSKSLETCIDELTICYSQFVL